MELKSLRGINLKEVCRQIKLSGKRSLIWSRQEGFHYITNRHWLIRFADDQLPREVLVVLFSVFAMIPENGKTYMTHLEAVNEQKPPGFNSIYSQLETAKPGKITPFSKDLTEKWRMRIIQFGSEFIFLDEEYARMVDQDEVASCAGKLSPVFFLDGAVVILPYRNTGDKSDQTALTELVGYVSKNPKCYMCGERDAVANLFGNPFCRECGTGIEIS